MRGFKNILKSMGIGALYLLMSFTVYQLVDAMIITFQDMMNYNGIYAVLFFFAGLFLMAVALVAIFFMGGLPLEVINFYKKKASDNK